MTPDQILVVQSLLYSKSMKTGEGGSVADWANDLRNDPQALDKLFSDSLPGEMTRGEFTNLLNKAATDPVFSTVTITHVEARNAGPLTPNSDQVMTAATFDVGGKPMVLFGGTGGDVQWRDNGTGGYYNVTDTIGQQWALEYFVNAVKPYGEHPQAIVAGHSKGGNLAQYVTVLAGGDVEACYSFDGQGFNAAFLAKYADLIAANGGKVTSISNPSDFVNILFNPLPGSQRYYHGDGSVRWPDLILGIGHPFGRWHSPYSIFGPGFELDLTNASPTPSPTMGGLQDFLGFAQRYMGGEDFRYLCWLVMGVCIEGDSSLYGDVMDMPSGFWTRVMALLKNYAETHGVSPAAILEYFSSLGALGLGFATPLAILYAITPSAGYQVVQRDFTQVVKQQLLDIVKEVEPHNLLQMVLDPVGDLWLHIKDWTGNLNFPAEADKRRRYYQQVIDMNNISAQKIEKIWADVGECDAKMRSRLRAWSDRVIEATRMAQRLADMIQVG